MCFRMPMLHLASTHNFGWRDLAGARPARIIICPSNKFKIRIHKTGDSSVIVDGKYKCNMFIARTPLIRSTHHARDTWDTHTVAATLTDHPARCPPSPDGAWPAISAALRANFLPPSSPLPYLYIYIVHTYCRGHNSSSLHSCIEQQEQ